MIVILILLCGGFGLYWLLKPPAEVHRIEQQDLKPVLERIRRHQAYLSPKMKSAAIYDFELKAMNSNE